MQRIPNNTNLRGMPRKALKEEEEKKNFLQVPKRNIDPYATMPIPKIKITKGGKNWKKIGTK